MESGFVEVDEYRVRYHLRGESGPGIVLLHGYGHFGQSLNFSRFMEDMSDSYRVLALDLLGHGGSSDPASPMGFERHATIMHRAATELGYASYSLIGYSFGGRMAMRLASLHGEAVERLVIVDVTPRTHPSAQRVTDEPGVPLVFRDVESAVDWLSGRSPGVPRAFWYANLGSLFFPEGGGGWRMSSHPSRKTHLVMDGDGWCYFGDISVPTMLIRGSESDSAPAEEVERMKETMEDLVVVTIEGADHSVPFTHPEEFEGEIREFIPIK